jgi:transketolase
MPWQGRVDSYRIRHPALANQFDEALCGRLPAGWEAHLPIFTSADNAMATRGTSRTIINALAAVVPHLVGASADVNPSTRMAIKGGGAFGCPFVNEHDDEVSTQDQTVRARRYAGRNMHCGHREQAMAAVMTGMALHRGVLPYGATLLPLSDCMRARAIIRLAAVNKAGVIYLWTHDRIAFGEDGPTHQPVEQLAGLRALPHLMIIRPSDATETVEAWLVALVHGHGPVGLVLTRQKLPVLDRAFLAPASSLARGAYVLADPPNGFPPDLLLIATGSEVSLALQAHAWLTGDAIRCRVVSMPYWELFDAQPQSCRNSVLPPAVRARVSIEAAAPFGWERYVELDGASIGVNGFGASAPGPVLMREFGFTPECVVETAKAVLNKISRSDQILSRDGATSPHSTSSLRGC